MKNFKLYVTVNGTKLLVTNSKDISNAATYEETCSIQENGQVSFSCSIAEYISPGVKNLFFDYFFPHNKLTLYLFDYNGNKEGVYDMIIKTCSPSFYHNNKVLNITAVDYASNNFAKIATGLTLEKTGNIYELAATLLAESGLNTEYQDYIKDWMDSSDIQVPMQLQYDLINTLYQKYYYDETIWNSLVNNNKVTADDQELMNKILEQLVASPTDYQLKMKRNSIFSKYYKSVYNETNWKSWITDSYVTTIDNTAMTTYLADINKYEGISNNCVITSKGIKISHESDTDPVKITIHLDKEINPKLQHKISFSVNKDITDFVISTSELSEITYNNQNFYYLFPTNEYLTLYFYYKSPIIDNYIKDLSIYLNGEPEKIYIAEEQDEIIVSSTSSSSEEYLLTANGHVLTSIEQVKNEKNLSWTVDSTCLVNFLEQDTAHNASNFIQNTLSIESSNLYNGLVELALLFNASIQFDYETKTISFENKDNRTYKGIHLDPNYNINNFSRESNINDFLTVINILSTADEDLKLLSDIPTELKTYLVKCIENDFISEEYFNTYDSEHTYKAIVEKIINSENFTGDTQALYDIAAILDTIPQFEEKIYNIDYFHNIGAIDDEQYENFTKIINNDLRKINIRLFFMSDGYYEYQSILSGLYSQYEYYSQLITTANREINKSTWQIAALEEELNNNPSETRKKQIETDIAAYKQSKASAEGMVESFTKELHKILGVDSDGSLMEESYNGCGESLYTLLLTIYGYTNERDNGYYKKYKEVLDLIEEKNEILLDHLTRISEIDKTLENNDMLESLRVTLQTERAGLFSDVLNLYHQLGTSDSIVNQYETIYNNAVEKYNEATGTATKIYWNNIKSTSETIAKEGVYTGYLYTQLNGYNLLLNTYHNLVAEGSRVKVGLYKYLIDQTSSYNLNKEKNNILQNLQNLYGDYLIEGYYEDDTAQTPLELLQQVLIIKNKNTYPAITYNVGIIDLSSLADYQYLTIAIGDRVKLYDDLFLQYNPTYNNYLEITGINYNLRQPESTTLTVSQDNIEEKLIQKLFLSMITKK